MRHLLTALLPVVALTAGCPRDDSDVSPSPDPAAPVATTPVEAKPTPTPAPAPPTNPVVGEWISKDTGEMFDFSSDGQVKVRKIDAAPDDASPRHGTFTFVGGRYVEFTLGGDENGEGGTPYKCELASGAITCTQGEKGEPFKLERGA